MLEEQLLRELREMKIQRDMLLGACGGAIETIKILEGQRDELMVLCDRLIEVNKNYMDKTESLLSNTFKEVMEQE